MTDSAQKWRKLMTEQTKSLILVVDDEDLLLQFLVRFLIAHGYKALPAHTKEEAVHQLEMHGDKVGVAFVDYSLGLVTGMDVVAALVGINSQIKVIMASGMDFDELKALTHPNIVEHIKKPFFGENLIGLIQKITPQASS